MLFNFNEPLLILKYCKFIEKVSVINLFMYKKYLLLSLIKNLKDG